MNFHYIVVDLDKLEVVKHGNKAKIFSGWLKADVYCSKKGIENYKTIEV